MKAGCKWSAYEKTGTRQAAATKRLETASIIQRQARQVRSFLIFKAGGCSSAHRNSRRNCQGHSEAGGDSLGTQGGINLLLGDGAFAEDFGLRGKAIYDG